MRAPFPPRSILTAGLIALTGCHAPAPLPTGCGDVSSRSAPSAPEGAGSAETLTDLGDQAVRTEAASWAELVDKTRPSLTWSDRYLIWIEADESGLRRVTLDEAYLVPGPNATPRRVLLDPAHVPMGRSPRAVAVLQEKRPEANNDAGLVEDYAVLLAHDPGFGDVYEIGWQKSMADGTGHAVELRLLYLWRDRAHRWRFLGEGLSDGQSKTGPDTGTSTRSTASVVWRPGDDGTASVEVRFTTESRDYAWRTPATEESETAPRPDLVKRCDWILAGDFPATLRMVGSRPYLLAESGDTLRKIAERNGAWQPGWAEGPDKTAQKTRVLALWRRTLRRMNPGLPAGRIPAGTRVELPNDAEYQKIREAVRLG